MKAVVNWNGKMSFTATGASGHAVAIDASPEVGGENTGSRPMELILHGLGGCTGIDILMILQKMRLEVQSFELEINGDRAEDHPKRYTDIHIHYCLEGELPVGKVRRAIELSQEKYCSVTKSLNANVTASFSINGNSYKMED
jgi:putative redox protein